MLENTNLCSQAIAATAAAFHTSPVCSRVQAGRYRVTTKRNRALTYEMANPPHYIAHRKAWNSWNTCTYKNFIITNTIFYLNEFYLLLHTASMLDGQRASQTAIEDVFMRKFMTGTWHALILSEVIIKRQHNMIRISAIVRQAISPRKVYFLIGYTEELLSYWLQCPVTLELQTVADKKDVIFKYI